MTRRLIINGPGLEDDILYCPVCVADWKMALLRSHGIDKPAALQEWIKKNLEGPDDAAPVFLAPKQHYRMPLLATAVTRMPVTKMGGAVLDVCWTHADTFSLEPQAPPGGPQRPPGLIVGMS